MKGRTVPVWIHENQKCRICGAFILRGRNKYQFYRRSRAVHYPESDTWECYECDEAERPPSGRPVP